MVAAPAVAQDYTNVTASGRVVGTSGEPIAGATITITSNDQGFDRTVQTDGSGGYRIGQVPPGAYTVMVSADGFETFTDANVNLSVDGAANQFALAPVGGSGNEIVVTAGRVQVVDFERTTTGSVIKVEELARRVPVARDLTSVIKLSPGTSQGDGAFGNLASISGSSVAENAFYINGLNITDFRKGLGSVTVPFDFYDTVEIKNGGFQAEFGRTTGGVVNATTKSGSNKFHGGVLFNYESEGLQAKGVDVLNPDTGAVFTNNSADERERIESVFQLSGPIIKDRLFFAAIYNTRNVTVGDGVATGFRYDRQKTTDPFWGVKVDAVVIDGQRLEFTYFDTSGTTAINSYDFDPTTNEISDYQSTELRTYGGANYVGRYTGNFTDWLTLSAAYGVNKSTDSTVASDNSYPTILDNRSGSPISIGNATNVIEIAEDKREFYRADADILFNALGSHHIRFGYDNEKLTSDNRSAYTGNVVYQYYLAGPGDAYAPEGTEYVSARTFINGGLFTSQNEAFYIQDNWSLLENRLTIQLGLRNDKFTNRNADGVAYYESGNQWGPRFGFSADPFGDNRTKIYGSFGRYFLPIPSNTNVRLAGAEYDLTRYNVLGGLNSDNTPIIGAALLFPGADACFDTNVANCENISDGEATPTEATVSKTLKPQSMDEFILGAEHRLSDRLKVGIYGTYRKLNAALEDVAIDAAVNQYCEDNNIGVDSDVSDYEECSATYSGFHQYVLVNPGDDSSITLSDVLPGETTVRTIDFTAAQLGYPKAKRTYKAVTFTFDREFDGLWSLAGSYTWSKTQGNIEGGVRSDNGQDDAGITTSFDQPGLVNGTDGYLPNDRRHNFKLYGAYQVTPWLLLGANLQVTSPRKFGCIGRVPRTVDPFAALYGAAGYYCNVDAEGNVITTGTVGNPTGSPTGTGTAPTLTPRGTVFQSDWTKELNLTASFKVPTDAFNASLRFDVFNVLNSKSKLDFEERGTLNSGQPRNTFGLPSAFQRPRYVRVQLGVEF